MAKKTKVQRDFSFGEILPNFIDGDDLETRGQSLKRARNVRITAARSAKARPGTFHLRNLTDGARQVVEFSPPNAGTFGVVIGDAYLEVLDATGSTVFLQSIVPWDDGDSVWTAGLGSQMICGGDSLHSLSYENGEWAFGEAEFNTTAGDERAVPFWAFHPSVSITPSARTGTIAITSDLPVFTAAHVGTLIRYASKQIQVVGFTGPSTISGLVLTELPKTFELTLDSAEGFLVGDVVTGDDTGWQGRVVDVTGVVVTALTLAQESGPLVGEQIASPRAAATLQTGGLAEASSPAATTVWDEQLISQVHGYPRAGAAVSGRLVLCDFPKVPDLVAFSAARGPLDFKTGLDDDDAIVRQAGNNGPRFMHVVGAADLILLSDRGCYFVKTRDGEIITPSNFQAIQFDQRAAADVRPVTVDDGVVFVEASGSQIAACVLSGNVYLNWSILPLSLYHAHLFDTPVGLCGPAQTADMAERYMLVVNQDGSVVAMSWSTEFGQERAGFVKWETTGAFKAISPVFDSYLAIASRDVNGASILCLEKFSVSAVMDCASNRVGPVNGQFLLDDDGEEITDDAGGDILAGDPGGIHIAGANVGIWGGQTFYGRYDLDSAGLAADPPDIDGDVQIGLPFTPSLKPWPAEHVDSARIGMVRSRVIRCGVSVYDTVSFSFRSNSTTRKVTDSGSAETKLVQFSVFGNRDHPEMEVFSDEPGPFEVTAIIQEVTV